MCQALTSIDFIIIFINIILVSYNVLGWGTVQYIRCRAGYGAQGRVNLTPVDKLSFRCLCTSLIIINERHDHKSSLLILSNTKTHEITFTNLSPYHSTCGMGCNVGDRAYGQRFLSKLEHEGREVGKWRHTERAERDRRRLSFARRNILA